MSETSDPRADAVRDFITLAQSLCTEGGWVEYLLWETVEGKRDRPFKLLPPLTQEQMGVLRRLRDEAGLWVFWQEGRWCHTTIDVWRPYAVENNSGVIFNRLHAGF